jgi:hypothetical protein
MGRHDSESQDVTLKTQQLRGPDGHNCCPGTTAGSSPDGLPFASIQTKMKSAAGLGGQQLAGVNLKANRVRRGLASRLSPVLVAGVPLFGAGEPSWSQEKIGGAQTVVNTVDGSLPTGNQVPVCSRRQCLPKRGCSKRRGQQCEIGAQ